MKYIAVTLAAAFLAFCLSYLPEPIMLFSAFLTRHVFPDKGEIGALAGGLIFSSIVAVIVILWSDRSYLTILILGMGVLCGVARSFSPHPDIMQKMEVGMNTAWYLVVSFWLKSRVPKEEQLDSTTGSRAFFTRCSKRS